MEKKCGYFKESWYDDAGVIGIITVAGAVLSPYIIRIVYGSRYEDATALSTVFWIVYAFNAGIRMVP